MTGDGRLPASGAVAAGGLGRLVSVDVRDFWADEARDFTPWLAQEANLKLLGETIDLELEPFKVEEPIGPFRADVVAKEGEQLVIIENQLGRADHGHLGQLLVYATNREAKAVVWIATKISDEYRKVLDWLNDNTPETIAFFGLEIELLRIGDSLPAPRFNVVCQPNALTKLERGGTGTEPTETKLLQLEFWTALRDYAAEKASPIKFRKPRPQHWYNFAVGRGGFHIALTVKTKAKEIACELYISGRIAADVAFEQLEEQKAEIEHELGALEWRALPEKGASRIVQVKVGDIEDQDGWPDLHAWCFDRVLAFYEAFNTRVQSLDLEIQAEEGEDPEREAAGVSSADA